MEMTNLKMSDDDAKEYAQPTLAAGTPEYPYGLCICLDEDTISKLGITTLPKVGQSMTMQAKVEVRSVSDSNSKDMGRQRRLELQITDMALAGSKGKEDTAKAIYG